LLSSQCPQHQSCCGDNSTATDVSGTCKDACSTEFQLEGRLTARGCKFKSGVHLLLD
jgi:hypothetical protein